MFLGENFQIQTQTINGWPDPTRATKIDPTQPWSKNFDPYPSLVKSDFSHLYAQKDNVELYCISSTLLILFSLTGRIIHYDKFLIVMGPGQNFWLMLDQVIFLQLGLG